MPSQNESLRLEKLEELGLLQRIQHEAVERITRLAARYFDVPDAAVTVIGKDQQWLRAGSGLPAELPRQDSFCHYAIQSEEILLVPDAQADPRFQHNPLVREGNIRFYAGAPLITHDGHALGSLCILDQKPRQLSSRDRDMLKDLAGLVVSHLEVQHAASRLNAITQRPNRLQWELDLSRFPTEEDAWVVLLDLLNLRDVTDLMRTLSNFDLMALMREVVQRMDDVLKRRWGLYHIELERIAVLLPMSEVADPEGLVGELLEQLRQPFQCGALPVRLEPRAGIVPLPRGDRRGADVLRLAISAALDARDQGQPYAFYDPAVDARHQRSFQLLTEVPRALTLPQAFRLVYQPRIELRTGRVRGTEALLRWTHSQLGAISPAEFIPLVEKSSLVQPVTDWVLQAAVQALQGWQHNHSDLSVSINIAAQNLQEKDLVDRIASALQRAGVPAEKLELEFTESAAVHDSAVAQAALRRLRELGVRMAIDDYGTGYSNLAALHRLPASVLKIDQSLIRGLPADSHSAAVIKATIEMAHQLGYRTVAEGVETLEVLRDLRAWGCDEVQGYYISRPLEPEDLPVWRRQWDLRVVTEGWPFSRT